MKVSQRKTASRKKDILKKIETAASSKTPGPEATPTWPIKLHLEPWGEPDAAASKASCSQCLFLQLASKEEKDFQRRVAPFLYWWAMTVIRSSECYQNSHNNNKNLHNILNQCLFFEVSSFVHYYGQVCWDFIFPHCILGRLPIFIEEHVAPGISEKKNKPTARGSSPLWLMSCHGIMWLRYKHYLKFVPKYRHGSWHCEFRNTEVSTCLGMPLLLLI